MSGKLFKKGQIIPKRIGGLHVHRKARHRWYLAVMCKLMVAIGLLCQRLVNQWLLSRSWAFAEITALIKV